MTNTTKGVLNLVQVVGLDELMIRILKHPKLKKLMLSHAWDRRHYHSFLDQYKIWRQLLIDCGINLAGRRVLDIGAGGSIGLGYFFWSDGIQSWTATDYFKDFLANRRELLREKKLITAVAQNFCPTITDHIKIDGDDIVFDEAFNFKSLDVTVLDKDLIGGYDLILTSAVLEHIPADKAEDAVINMMAYLAPGGIMMHEIDLRDHINMANPLNFLRYSASEWNKLTGDSIFYTNRLRINDWLKCFDHHGLKVVHQSVERVDQSKIPPKVAADFSPYKIDDLTGTRIMIILQKI